MEAIRFQQERPRRPELETTSLLEPWIASGAQSRGSFFGVVGVQSPRIIRSFPRKKLACNPT